MKGFSISNKKNVPSSLPRVPVSRLVGHDGPVQAVCFTADGKYCLTGGHDRTVRLWNPLRPDPAFPPPPQPSQKDEGIPFNSLPRALPIQTYSDALTHPITALAVDTSTGSAPNSQILLAASEKTLVVTDMVTQQVKRRLQGHAGRINAVCMSLGSETYISASYDATVRIWDGRSRSYEPIQILKQAKDSVTSVHVVQDEGLALIRSASVDGFVRTYDIRKGEIRCDDCEQPITSMASTHDGECLAVSCLDGIIRLVDIKSGELLNTYESHHKAGQYGLDCCITADDSTIVTGSEDGRVVLYDFVRATPVQTLVGHTRPTCSIAVHPQKEFNSVVVSASYDGNAVVWANDHGIMQRSD